MADTLNVRIKHKRDTSANWTAKNPVLLNGELVIVDTEAGEVRCKIGDGVKTYTQLPFNDEALRSLVNSKADAVDVPTKTSDLTNDSGFITTADIPEGAAASTTSPKMDGTAAVGTELAFARGDHVHPSDTSRVPVTRTVNGKALSANITLSASDVNADAYGAASSALTQAKAYTDTSIDNIASNFESVIAEMYDGGNDLTSDGSLVPIRDIASDEADDALADAKSYTDEKVAELTNGNVTVSHATNANEANHAASADIAGEADHAVLADSATNADHATSADTAAMADRAASADAATFAVSANKASMDSDGNVICDTYETKDDASAKLTAAKEYTDDQIADIDYPVDSVNGKTGAVSLTYSDVGAAAASHTHTIANVTNLQTELDSLESAIAGKAASSHSHSTATTSAAGFMSASDKAKLDGVEDGAQVNQNAFFRINVGGSSIQAESETDEFILSSGYGISNSVNTDNNQITITNSGVRSVGTGDSNGTIKVNTNGTYADVAVKGLGSAAYTESSAYDASGAAASALTDAKAYADDIKNDLLNGAGTAYDTLKELGDLIDTNADAIDALETVAAGKANASHTHGNITNAGAIGTAANKAVITTTNGVLTTGTVPIASGGTGATTAAGALTNLGITATAAELNIMDGVTATTAELNYVDGVTSNIQTQLNAKAASGHTHSDYAAKSHTHSEYVNPNNFSVFYAGETTVTPDSSTDQLNFSGGNGVVITGDNDSGFKTVTIKANLAGDSTWGVVQSGGDVTIANGVITVNDDSHNHTIANVDGLQTALDSKAASDHTHNIFQTFYGVGTSGAQGITASGNDKLYLFRGSGIDIVGDASDSTRKKITIEGMPAGTETNTLGMVKSGGDVTIADGVITVNDDSHNHTIANVDGLQTALDGKAASSHGTHVTYSTTAPVMDGTAAAGSATTVARSDHKHPVDTSRAAKSDLDTHVADTTKHITSTERTNWGAAYTHSQTAHAPSNAEKNQNAFSNVTVGSTTIAADSATDTLTLVAGDNVSLTADSTNDNITINAINSGFDIIYAGTATINSAGGVSQLAFGGGNGVSVTGNANDNTVTISGTAATTTTPGVMSAADKTKLDGITAGANKYTHPTYTAKSSGLYKVTVDGTGHVSGTAAVAKADITALGIPAQDTTYSNMTAATASAAGKAGLVPAPAAGKQASYLRGDGTWAVPTNTTYNAATTSAAGLMSAADKTKLDGIATGATKITVDTALSSTSTNPVQNNVINTALAGKAASSHTHAAGDIASGTLAVARGGTGVTANPSMLTNLGSTSAASVFAASPRPGVTGTLPIANGGTGATTAIDAKANLGITAEWLNSAHNHQGQNINPSALELNPGTSATHGGYIDFHFGGDTGDYTSRIIEESSGSVRVSGTLKVTSPGATTNAVRNIFANTSTPTVASAEGTIRLVYE